MLSLFVPAKVNLFLEVMGDRGDGYHDLRMLMQSISLGDLLHIELIPEGIEVQSNHGQVPLDNSNLAVKAVDLLQTRFGSGGGVKIVIDKNIPIGGGLGGGSANGAGVLWGLNQLWQLGLTNPELQELGLKLGSDVPFCLMGGTAIARGRGEILTPVPNFPSCDLVLTVPKDISVSTPWAYQTFRAEGLLHKKTIATESLWQGLLNVCTPQAVSGFLYNDLERVVLPNVGAIAQLRQELTSLGCLGTLMSGSGACVFGICGDRIQAEQISTQLSGKGVSAWAVTTGNHQIQIAS